MIGTAARNGQENGTRATPNISVTTGDITSHTSTVSTAHDTKEARNRGLVTVADGSCGQASRRRTTSAAARPGSRRKEGEQAGLGDRASGAERDQAPVPEKPSGQDSLPHAVPPCRATERGAWLCPSQAYIAESRTAPPIWLK